MTFDELSALIRERRTSMLVDKTRPVPRDLVERLCELAQWAPNHKRTWPWRFCFVTDGRDRFGNAIADVLAAQGEDADKVWFVFREDYYVAAREPKHGAECDVKATEDYEKWRQEMERVFGVAELIVAKQRHGSTGKVRMKFEAKITKFSDLADDNYDQGYD